MPGDGGETSQHPMLVPFFRPRKSGSSSFRKRTDNVDDEFQQNKKKSGDKNDVSDVESSDSSGSSAAPEKMRIKLSEKRKRLRGHIHTTSKKQRKEMDELSEDSSEDEDDGKNKFDPNVKFASTGVERTGPSDMGATARTEIDTDYTRDSQAQFERIQEIKRKERQKLEERLAEEEEDRKKYGERAKKIRDAQEAGTSKPKVYQGMALYGAKEKEDTIKGNASSGLNRLGPIRAPQYMRASVRWDYAPDICKDYKETGFCTFGDSCKFMHDRTDYKHGWEIERDWEQGKMKEAKEDEYLISSEEGETEEDKLPHSCYICREHFKQPVVTKCKHYFCEECALKHYQKSKKCAVCGEKTDGVFNIARDILARIKVRDKSKTQHESSDEEGLTGTVKILPMSEETIEREIQEESGESEEHEDDYL